MGERALRRPGAGQCGAPRCGGCGWDTRSGLGRAGSRRRTQGAAGAAKGTGVAPEAQGAGTEREGAAGPDAGSPGRDRAGSLGALRRSFPALDAPLMEVCWGRGERPVMRGCATKAERQRQGDSGRWRGYGSDFPVGVDSRSGVRNATDGARALLAQTPPWCRP